MTKPRSKLHNSCLCANIQDKDFENEDEHFNGCYAKSPYGLDKPLPPQYNNIYPRTLTAIKHA
jgi:hypothetical protein